jgi:hypothetical protein
MNFGPSGVGNKNAASTERHWPTALSMPRETARWDCEPVFPDCQEMIRGMLESVNARGQYIVSTHLEDRGEGELI